MLPRRRSRCDAACTWGAMPPAKNLQPRPNTDCARVNIWSDPAKSQRVLSAEAASARFGLPHKAPEIRELWYVPKGTPARVNPVWGGARDASETTLTRPLPPRNLIHADPVAELPR
jgi:hypothetical protein